LQVSSKVGRLMKESGLEELKIVLFVILSLSTNKNVYSAFLK
jgi:hypothetical protein